MILPEVHKMYALRFVIEPAARPFKTKEQEILDGEKNFNLNDVKIPTTYYSTKRYAKRMAKKYLIDYYYTFLSKGYTTDDINIVAYIDKVYMIDEVIII